MVNPPALTDEGLVVKRRGSSITAVSSEDEDSVGNPLLKLVDAASQILEPGAKSDAKASGDNAMENLSSSALSVRFLRNF